MAAEGTVVGVDGAVPVVVTAAALREPDGGRAGSVLVLRDVRQEREAERMKTEFLANIGHELRSPLTPIKGYAGVLARRPLDEEQAGRFAAEIGAGVDQLERVIGQLVNFATVAAGRLELRPEPVPVWDLVDGAVHRWRERAGLGHGIARRVSPRLPAVAVDRRHLDQAIDELIDNAVKYSPAGSRVVISAALCTEGKTGPDGAGRSVRLSVADHGVGIDPRRLDRLVTEFAQGDGSATRRFGGLGLGLAFADRIVRAHGGTLTCTSTAGSGATFSIVLPLPSGPVTADGGP
jgi:two-component system phosphate regulon sensor histidine kinase PhoR